MSELVLTERDGPIAVVTLNRPDALNALSDELMEQLVATLQELDRDDEVRCIVLGGNDKAFAAGADIARAGPLVGDRPLLPAAHRALGRDPRASGRRSSRRSPATASAAAASWRWRAT